jgi:hypothetical protein
MTHLPLCPASQASPRLSALTRTVLNPPGLAPASRRQESGRASARTESRARLPGCPAGQPRPESTEGRVMRVVIPVERERRVLRVAPRWREPTAVECHQQRRRCPIAPTRPRATRDAGECSTAPDGPTSGRCPRLEAGRDTKSPGGPRPGRIPRRSPQPAPYTGRPGRRHERRHSHSPGRLRRRGSRDSL